MLASDHHIGTHPVHNLASIHDRLAYHSAGLISVTRGRRIVAELRGFRRRLAERRANFQLNSDSRESIIPRPSSRRRIRPDAAVEHVRVYDDVCAASAWATAALLYSSTDLSLSMIPGWSGSREPAVAVAGVLHRHVSAISTRRWRGASNRPGRACWTTPSCAQASEPSQSFWSAGGRKTASPNTQIGHLGERLPRPAY